MSAYYKMLPLNLLLEKQNIRQLLDFKPYYLSNTWTVKKANLITGLC